MKHRQCPDRRASFSVFYPLETRWADNDIYGHINNVAYYTFFDTVVNRFLIERGGLRPESDLVVGFVVNSGANFFSPLRYPQKVDLGLRVNRLGRKSVTWGVGVFAETRDISCVTGVFTHAFVDRATGKSALIPAQVREAIESLTDH